MNIQAQVQHRLVGVDRIKHQEVGDGTILFLIQLTLFLTYKSGEKNHGRKKAEFCSNFDF